MNQLRTRNRVFTHLEYPRPEGAWQGILTDLPGKLAQRLEFDSVTLQSFPRSRKITLWFRSGAKKVFHVRVIRKAGRCLVEVGGLEAAAVLPAIFGGRDHFDAGV